MNLNTLKGLHIIYINLKLEGNIDDDLLNINLCSLRGWRSEIDGEVTVRVNINKVCLKRQA